MKRIFKWMKKHIRPYYKYNERQNLSENRDDQNGYCDKLEDLKENSEVGVKIKFKF